MALLGGAGGAYVPPSRAAQEEGRETLIHLICPDSPSSRFGKLHTSTLCADQVCLFLYSHLFPFSVSHLSSLSFIGSPVRKPHISFCWYGYQLFLTPTLSEPCFQCASSLPIWDMQMHTNTGHEKKKKSCNSSSWRLLWVTFFCDKAPMYFWLLWKKR